MKNILLVDDHQILLDGILELINKTGRHKVIGTVGTARKALDFLNENYQDVDVIITDIGLPDMNGTTLTALVKKKFIDIYVIALSMHEEKHIVKDAIKAGVDGYVLKKSTHEDLNEAIESVIKGEKYVSPAITHLLMDSIRNPSIVDLLSEREKEIIRLITQEYTTKKIAEMLFISEKTVEAHKTNIFRKTNTSTIVGLVKFAIQHRLG